MVMLELQVNGLTTRVQVLEDRLDKLSENVGAVKNALQFCLDGIKSALYKAEYVSMRSKQMESIKLSGNESLVAIFDTDEPKSPIGERESLENFAARLFGPGGGRVTLVPPPPKDGSSQKTPQPPKRIRYPVSPPTNNWGGKPGEFLPDAPSRGNPVRTRTLLQEQALAQRAQPSGRPSTDPGGRRKRQPNQQPAKPMWHQSIKKQNLMIPLEELC